MTGHYGPFWAGVWDGACGAIIVIGIAGDVLRRRRKRNCARKDG